jgi:signal transduction histidine kinase
MFHHRWQKRIAQWQIHQKIGYGYLISITVGVIGSTIGVVVADELHQRVAYQMTSAHTQTQLLSHLSNTLTTVQLEGVQLIGFLNDPQQFQDRRQHFSDMVLLSREIQRDLQDYIQRHLPTTDDIAHLEDLEAAIQDAAVVVNAYQAQIELDLPSRSPTLWSSDEIAAIQQRLLSTSIGDEVRNLERVTEQINLLLDHAQRQESYSEAMMAQMATLEKVIILVSLSLSVAIAGIIAIVTTRRITQPILDVTAVAQKAAQESNFQIQAPVTTQDEIGTLAMSLNQLIQRVAERTQELEASAQTAEEQAQQLRQTVRELKTTQIQLIQTEKMSSLGQLVAGIAHEMNNPINFIHGNLDYAKQYILDIIDLLQVYQHHYPNPHPDIRARADQFDLQFVIDDLPKLLNSIQSGTQRIYGIVRSLRTFSRLDEADMKLADIHEGIESALMLLGNRLKAKPTRPEIQLIRKYGKAPQIECYPGQLNQVFMHILNNAIDAIEVDLTRWQSSDQVPSITIRTDMHQADIIAIAITDNGIGMTSEVQRKLFDPFFSTKPVGEGTGLGMAISHQIIAYRHQGVIKCQSTYAQGTTISIELPTCQH